MNSKEAVKSLTALAHDTRFAMFRFLMVQGPSGASAGTLSEHLNVAPSTLSFHLRELERGNLLRSWRVGRQLFYAAEFETMRRLLAVMVEDCCHGRPEICGDLVQLKSFCNEE
ncbi:MAG: helix-turn-helix domain-containing protein [Pseudomonadota bacterium]